MPPDAVYERQVETAVTLAFLWAGFAGSHLVLSSARLRPLLVARLGLRSFLGLYSLLAFAFFVPLVWIFFANRHAGPLLWITLGPPAVARALNHGLMAAALVLLVSSLLPGSAAPSAMQATGPSTVRGITRITRHPLFMALACFGLAHLLVNGNLADVAFFGGFPLFSWVGARHQDERLTRERDGYGDVVRASSVLPFAAIAAGRQRLVPGELSVGVVAVGLALTVVLRVYHRALFGP